MYDDIIYGYNHGSSPYYYDYGMNVSGGAAPILAYILSTFGALLVIYGIYRFIAWIFGSVGLYHMAKDRGIAHAWFAWIPILSYYIEGRLINNKVVLGDSIVLKHAEFFLPFLSLIAVTSTTAGFVASIFMSIVWVYQMSALWRLFKIYRPKSRTSFTIWSAILSPGIFLFLIRNDRPFDPLEPNKIYENFYGEKQVVEDRYDRMEDRIRNQEESERTQLRDNYEYQLRQPGLTEEQREDLEDRYRADLNRIENRADNEINAQRERERQDIYQLDIHKPEEVDETDVYQQKPELDQAPPTFQEVDLEQTMKVDNSGIEFDRTVSLKDENSISSEEIERLLNQEKNINDE